MSDAVARLNAALEGRYRIERELGEGGMMAVNGTREVVIQPPCQWISIVEADPDPDSGTVVSRAAAVSRVLQ